MVVKENRGRRRYVAFTVDPSLSKDSLEAKIASIGYRNQFKIIQCVDGWCIARCSPNTIGRLEHVMSSADPGSRSLATSGNLITLRRRYPALWDTRSRYIAYRVSAEMTEKELADSVASRPDTKHVSVKMCMSGYAIVRCPLRDVEATNILMKDIDSDSAPFLSSYKASELRRAIANREPQLRNILLARK